jgi:Raf kinase inhibitor-like YbhB/YbcL family protein
VSNDASTWATIFSTTTGDGGTDDLAVSGSGRYLRVHGTQRGTAYGYSLFELQVFGTTGGGDTEPPTAPTGLRLVGAAQPTSVELAWNASTDNVGVATYEISNGGNILKSVGGNQTGTVVENLTPNTSYDLTVAARDAAGNPSQASNSLQVTTPKADDSQPPTAPGQPVASAATQTSITLTWPPATDNIGVVGYQVYSGTTAVASVPDTTATIDGLTPDTSYTYTVRARDAAGNLSPASPPVTARTTAPGSGGGDPVFDREVTKLDLPWGIGFLPDNSALVAERDRFEVVRVTQSGQKTVVGTVTEARTTTGEGGLLGLAISPTFASDHYVYLYYTAESDNRVARAKFENNRLGAREPIVTGMAKNRFHNGGRIRFGPDGFLYISSGDARNPNSAQSVTSLNGKILRVTPTGAPAPGNPFLSNSNANAKKVYSLGHRNPQGLAWDSRGRLWESEFGEGNLDELNLIQAGKNYGWPECEGPCNNTGFVNPVRTWSVASASPSGIEIVGDWIYMAAVRGARLWVMKINGNTTDTPRAFFNGRWGRLRTVVKTPDGGLWLTSTNNDKNGGTPDTIDNVIVRLRFAGGDPGPFTLTSGAFANNGNIPDRYSCAGDGASGNDPSPPLAWSGAPAGARSFAITFIDTANGNKHWTIWDIPAARTSLPEGLGLGFEVPNQSPAKQKAMSSGNKALQFFGPCPGGSRHLYEFTLYALNVATLPGLSSSSTPAQVETAAKANAVASTKLAGNSSAST